MIPDFTIYPAVDIKGRKCVRLFQGRAEEETVFSDDPVEIAAFWEEEGASFLHVVDLDGAFQGRPVNDRIITELIKRVTIPVQVGGGIRSADSAGFYLDSGASRIVVGTGAFTDPQWLARLVSTFKDQLVVGVDVKEGHVTTNGWLRDSGLSAVEAVRRLEEAGVERIIYTDTSRDGTLEGPNFEGIEELASGSKARLIASGGVSQIDDVLRISRMRELGVEGVIIGMALYSNRFTLDQLNEAILERGSS